jgi:3-deoxy-D-manno-octulosonic-acid transferase
MQTLLYRFGTSGYFSILRIASLFNGKAKKFIVGRSDITNRIAQAVAGDARPRIWVHCASLGEFEQGRPVIEALKKRYPSHAVFLTFFSPSGYEVRKHYTGADYVFYLPTDTPGNAKLFIQSVAPVCSVFVKYELWYYYLRELNRRNVPTFLISAVFQPRQGFFKWYGGLQRKMLATFASIFVQDVRSKELLQGIGIKRVMVAGDTRFDRVIEVSAEAAELPLMDAFCKGNKVLVAGSTWESDHRLLLKALDQLPDWKLVLVPHEVTPSGILALTALIGRQNVSLWSSGNVGSQRILVVDTIGLLSKLYRYGTVAWIGGGLDKAGVHNVLEAAVYGIPCIFGPVHHQFIEASELLQSGGAVVVESAGQLVERLNGFGEGHLGPKAGEAARQYVFTHSGATQKVLAALEAVLGNSNAR